MTESDALRLIELAKQIRKDIDGSRLFGSPIDIENVNHLIVAAYFLGLNDGKMSA